MKPKTDEIRIGHRGDMLTLLGEMITRIEKSNAQASAAFRGMDKAIGSEGYYWPRLVTIRDAIERTKNLGDLILLQSYTLQETGGVDLTALNPARRGKTA
jgi:hypothetical protein